MPLKDDSSSRTRAKRSSTAMAGCASSAASSSATCDSLKRTWSPAVSPTPAIPAQLRSHSSGTIPVVPSSSVTVARPWRNASSRRGSAHDLAAAEIDRAVQLEPIDPGS